MMQPRVSLIIPVFRVEKMIEQCARSLFNQSYGNIEYIFIDDCSDDASIMILESVIEQFPERKKDCKIITHEKNLGLAAARFTGISNSSGKYVWHIDSDDEIPVDSVLNLVEKAEDENADIVLFDALEIQGDSQAIIKNYLPANKEDETALTLIRQKNFALCFRFIRRNLFEGLQTDNRISMGEDWATTPRITSRASNISYLDKICYLYYRNSASITGSISKKGIVSLMHAFNVLENYFDKTIYRKYLPIAKKVLIIHSLKMARGDSNVYSYVFNKFKFEETEEDSLIRLGDRVILWMTNKNMRLISRLYIKIACKISMILGSRKKRY